MRRQNMFIVATADEESDDGSCQVLDEADARGRWLFGAPLSKGKFGAIGNCGRLVAGALDHLDIGAGVGGRILHHRLFGEAIALAEDRRVKK